VIRRQSKSRNGLTYQLDAPERADVTAAAQQVWRSTDLESEAALRTIALASHELPRGLRSFLTDFRLNLSAGFCTVRGWQLAPGTPATPARLAEAPPLVDDGYLLLLSSLLGDPFGWSTQQRGRIVHDILPVRGMEQSQLGASSLTTLDWHTEDAFHPLRPDFLALFCIRNPSRTATTVAVLDPSRLTERELDALFEPGFLIYPDTSHRPTGSSALLSDAEAEPVALLYGDRRAPFVRADRAYMAVAGQNPTAEAALRSLCAVLDSSLVDVVLEPGDVCIIHNHRAVHGRRPFTPRYDGTDRWLKRICITRDLRPSYRAGEDDGVRLQSAFADPDPSQQVTE
jgi:Fe(II)/alpha-ketoglutarate-dependent arginine beta-hydroxylase